ncbi:MAG: hypothetical protein M3155_01680 [Actinomycetota bacterium]|nr:hypothetical protein [Actinomycetota bacterium]
MRTIDFTPGARRIVVLALLALGCALDAASAQASDLPPFAAGDSSANIDLKTAGRMVMNRWVARETGTITTLYLQVRTAGSTACTDDPGGMDYGAGTSGVWRSTTHPVLPDGRPDMSVTLAQSDFSPCAHNDGNSEAIPLGIPVVKGQMYATVVQNADPDPAHNFFSQNFLYAASGLVGANARNELNPDAADTYYGIDPRELVGYSSDGGATWSLPGGPYGPNGGRAFIPTFVEQFADGYTGGQPYYSSHLQEGPLTMVYRLDAPTTVTGIGAYTSGPGEADVTLLVDGVRQAVVHLAGQGYLRAAIDPVAVAAGKSLTLATVAGSAGLNLRRDYGGSVWADLMGFGSDYPRYLVEQPQYAAPVYPLTAAGAPVGPPDPGPRGDSSPASGDSGSLTTPGADALPLAGPLVAPRLGSVPRKGPAAKKRVASKRPSGRCPRRRRAARATRGSRTVRCHPAARARRGRTR